MNYLPLIPEPERHNLTGYFISPSSRTNNWAMGNFIVLFTPKGNCQSCLKQDVNCLVIEYTNTRSTPRLYMCQSCLMSTFIVFDGNNNEEDEEKQKRPRTNQKY